VGDTMRCLACNVLLTDFEATRRYTQSREFVDLCTHCLAATDDMILVTERNDLAGNEDYDERELTGDTE
jgi:hypothetical protein